MQNNEKYYLTTTTPYVNSDPHIGFAMEIIHADVIARFQALRGKQVVFNTGTDEHGAKIFKKAQELGKGPQAYVDEYAPKFKNLIPLLNLSVTNFIRTTDAHHKSAAQEFWRRCLANGDIYKKEYKIKYCTGCELEKTDSELVEDKCPIHPNLEIETREEENYFFRFSKYQQPLLDFYAKYPDFVVPDFRFHEIKKFVEGGLQDFSISRLKEKMPWGVPVPDDDAQVMYVWFDALVNYISTLGWPNLPLPRHGEGLGERSNFEQSWGTKENPKAVQFAGKDNLRQQSAMWQAMLFSAGLPNSRHIVIHGFITSGGQKMSKSLGNVADPVELVNKYGVDALRYYLCREIPTFEDGDYSEEKFVEAYNAHLANGIGNLSSRILKMAQNAGLSLASFPSPMYGEGSGERLEIPHPSPLVIPDADTSRSGEARPFATQGDPESMPPVPTGEVGPESISPSPGHSVPSSWSRDVERAGERSNPSMLSQLESEDTLGTDNPEYFEALQNFNIKKAADYLWLKISGLDLYIQQHEPYKKIKVDATKAEAEAEIIFLLKELFRVAKLLEPFLPETAKKISTAISAGEVPSSLFPRIE